MGSERVMYQLQVRDSRAEMSVAIVRSQEQGWGA